MINIKYVLTLLVFNTFKYIFHEILCSQHRNIYKKVKVKIIKFSQIFNCTTLVQSLIQATTVNKPFLLELFYIKLYYCCSNSFAIASF